VKEEKPVMLSEQNQAHLFALIAQEVVDTFGEAGVTAISEGVVRYGEQRGKRMAMRTAADGLERTALNYLAYKEFATRPGEMLSQVSIKNRAVQLLVDKCPWQSLWKQAGLLEKYGYLYCKDLDVAIARGYNRDIQFAVQKNKGLGDDVCDMRICDDSGMVEDQAVLEERIKALGLKAKMPWDYHCAHLYKTLRETVAATFGQAGEEALQRSMTAFITIYGQQAGAMIDRYMDTDFNTLPPYAGING